MSNLESEEFWKFGDNLFVTLRDIVESERGQNTPVSHGLINFFRRICNEMTWKFRHFVFRKCLRAFDACHMFDRVRVGNFSEEMQVCSQSQNKSKTAQRLAPEVRARHHTPKAVYGVT